MNTGWNNTVVKGLCVSEGSTRLATLKSIFIAACDDISLDL